MIKEKNKFIERQHHEQEEENELSMNDPINDFGINLSKDIHQNRKSVRGKKTSSDKLNKR
jgi:hypothetical protein